MKNRIIAGARIALGLDAVPEFKAGARIGSIWVLECRKPDGSIRWNTGPIHNLVLNVALQHILDILFVSATSQLDPFYVGLTAGSPSPAAGDTMASHAGWTEFTTYSEAARQEFVDVRTAQSVDNDASKAAFSINGSGTVGGAFMVSNNTKGGSTGTLLCAVAATEGNRSVVNGDTINAKCTFSLADDGS